MPRLSAASRLLALALLTVALATGCSEERPPVSRVQASALAKQFFVGELANPADDPEFFMHVSVIDVMFGANSDGLITSADGQAMTRVRWEITEKALVARLRYELIQDSDKKGLRATPDGQIVAAFAIEKHFDIRNDYNPSTGEELNVVVENDSDRPWYAREYFRVDWSKNLINDAYTLDTLAQIGILYAVEWEPLAYYVSDPSHPDAPVFAPDEGYFDITNKVLAKPGVVDFGEWGKVPACWLIGAFPEQSCNPTEVKLRTSFKRVTDTDYEPSDWNGEKMDVVGVFTQDRFGFETGYGVVDDKWHRFASRWNLFAQSHTATACATAGSTPFQADVHRDENQDGTEDECAAVGRGSRCDEFRKLCTIPTRDRAIRTIPWFVNEGFPTELYAGVKETLEAWNSAVRVGVLAGRLAECRRTQETDCEAKLGWPNPWSDDYVPPVGSSAPNEVANVFVLCHNPVEEGDDSACGAVGTAARLGDLRYNFITDIAEPQTMSPWGIMVDAEDPLSGEKISGSVNIWGARTDHAAAQLADQLMLVEGLIDPASYIAGKNVTSWVNELRDGGVAAKAGRALSKEELDRLYRAFDPKVLAPYVGDLKEPQGNTNPRLAQKRRMDALAKLGRLGPGNGALTERLQRLKGSPVEAQMISPEMAQLAGFNPQLPATTDAVRRASPFGWKNPSVQRALKRQGMLARAKNGSCRLDREDVEPDNLIGLAIKAKKLFGSPSKDDPKAIEEWRKKIYDWARVEYTKGVLAHELGHSMGLRHNFAASFDSLNYDPQYWQLRTHNATVTTPCADGTKDGTNCIGPRWRDPIAKEELEGDIGLYATTSVMDYPGDTAQDTRLLGKYDRAAMRLIYGDVVDVWAKPGVSVKGSGDGKAKAYKLTAFASNPGLMGVYYFPPTSTDAPYQNLHYSEYQKEFELLSDCAASSDADAVFGQKCKEQPLDVVAYRDMASFSDNPDLAEFSWGRLPRTVDPDGRVRRGYLFQSDEYADAGNVTTFTDDAGADAYEIVRFLESQYELRYVMDNFRRNRTTFNSDQVTHRVQVRYLDPIEAIAKTFAFAAILNGDPSKPSADFLKDGAYGPLGLASSTALDLFGRILTRPEPGYYCSSADCYFVPQPVGVEGLVYGVDTAAQPNIYGYNFNLPLGQGRYVSNDFDYTQGYWWGDYQTQVGSYYDKVWAIYYLSEAFDFFISNSKDDFIDGRYKNVNFATVYPEQVRRLYNALLTGDYDTFAPRVTGLDDIDLNPPEFPVLYPEWTAPNGPPAMAANAKIVEPSYGWNERIYAMVFGSIFFPTNWSYDFINQARLAVLPSEMPDWYDDEIRAFYDPKSGLTYRARSTGTESLLGHAREKASGARMVEWANKLLAEAYKVERDGNNKPKLDKYGTPILIWDPKGHAQLDEAHPSAAAALQAYVDQMDLFRQLTNSFAQPLENLPQP